MKYDVTWDEVLPIAEEAFHIWVDQPELRWAEQAWKHLAKAGLTGSETSLDRLAAYICLLVLASMYRDWCAVVWDEVDDDSPGVWLSNADDVSPVLIGQLLGPDDEVGEDPEDPVDEALNILMERERKAVVAAVLKGFGGVEGLFVALWRSNTDPEKRIADDDEDDWRDPPETDADIINDATSEKLAGYEWIREGCQSRGPIRSASEMDDWLG